uniref:Caspase n=1 Tax=Plectus sambesii TaxID=2011161 RepID=A0A914V6W0_9BILA
MGKRKNEREASAKSTPSEQSDDEETSSPSSSKRQNIRNVKFGNIGAGRGTVHGGIHGVNHAGGDIGGDTYTNSPVVHGDSYSGAGSGQKNTFDNRNNRGRQVAGPNYGTVNLGNTTDNSQRTSHTFGDHASRMVNAPVTGDISFGDTHDNSQRTRYHQDNRGNRGHQITGGTFSGATFNQPVHHGPHTDNSVHAPSNQGLVSVGPNSGTQVGTMHDVTQHTQLAHGNINSGAAAGQHNTFGDNASKIVTAPVTGPVSQGDTEDNSQHIQGLSQSKETKDAGGKIECYPLNTKPKGHMLIIANEIYHDGDHNDGALVDRNKMETLGRILGYNVKSSHENLTAEEMRTALKDFVIKIETEPHLDSAIIFVLAHGAPDEVFGVDGEGVERKEFFDAMKPKNCAALTGKPKLIFFDACRGDEDDPGAVNKQKSGAPQEQAGSETGKPYTPEEKAVALAAYEIKKANAYAEQQESGKEVKRKGSRLSIMSDMLIVDATAMDYYAYGSESGSDFIDAIYDVFKANYKTKNIDDMLHMVHEHVLKSMHGGMEEDADHFVEGTNYMSSLRKRFMFCPPSTN